MPRLPTYRNCAITNGWVLFSASQFVAIRYTATENEYRKNSTMWQKHLSLTELLGLCFQLCMKMPTKPHTDVRTDICLFPRELGPKALLQRPLFKPSVSSWAPHAERECRRCEEGQQLGQPTELSCSELLALAPPPPCQENGRDGSLSGEWS